LGDPGTSSLQSHIAKAEEQEQHASFLEENLLMQLRAATKGRIYDIWVHRTKIRIRVGQFFPVIEFEVKLMNR